jgi:hypothetical protein
MRRLAHDLVVAAVIPMIPSAAAGPEPCHACETVDHRRFGLYRLDLGKAHFLRVHRWLGYYAKPMIFLGRRQIQIEPTSRL